MQSSLPHNLQTALEHPVQLPAFEGPLDLLLYLLKRDELDIYDIPIATVTTQYLRILRQMESRSLELAGEFFVMAATLMLIKSRMLLPPDQLPLQEAEAVEEGTDPRWALVEQLLEYKKYKEAAQGLEACIMHQGECLARRLTPSATTQHRPLRPVEPLSLAGLFGGALLRLRERLTVGRIQADTVTVADRIAWILTYLTKSSAFIFSKLWDIPPPRPIITTTFLAILELTRLKELTIKQTEPFAEIHVSARPFE